MLHLEERLLGPGGGVRDADVEPAGALVGLAHGPLALAHLGELGLDRPCGRPESLDLGADGVQAVLEVVDNGDGRSAFVREAQRGLASHAAAAAGDEDGLFFVSVGNHAHLRSGFR